MIEKENPGIVEDGWIDLFLKNSIPKKRKPPSRAQTFTKSTKNISI